MMSASPDLPINRFLEVRNARVCSVVAAVVLAGTWALAHTGIHAPLCPFHALTGLPCPGCGLTRCALALWHGSPCLAFRYHPLGVTLFALCVALLLLAMGGLVFSAMSRTHARLVAWLLRPTTVTRLLFVFLVWWAVRLLFLFSGSRFFLS
jgi:hypothetical protein